MAALASGNGGTCGGEVGAAGGGEGNGSPTTAAAAAAAAAAMAATRSFLEKLHSSHALTPPAAVELRDVGVWAKERVAAGTRYGPFLGKWALEPANPAYAWEVSEFTATVASVS